MRILSIFLLLPIGLFCQSFPTPYEQSNFNASATYDEVIDFYSKMAETYPGIEMVEFGKTDIGKPLHVVFVSGEEIADINALKSQNKSIILINNGIHAGESCGIDASMMLVRDLMNGKINPKILDNVVLAIIPVYNVGGYLNRSCCTRANQLGPEEQGFRGNAKNLDLNRDFIKADAANTQAFYEIFHRLNPDVFVDTHTSNGADYQYVMTLISTQKDKLHPAIAHFMQNDLDPNLYAGMEAAGFPMTPYVYSKGNTPGDGLIGFLETPRYSTGYTALFNTVGYVTEAHMLKTYQQRVEATYTFLNLLVEQVNDQHEALQKARKKAAEQAKATQTISWSHDTTSATSITFLGYASGTKTSKATGLPRLYYDTTKPQTMQIPFYNDYLPKVTVDVPQAYIIPQAWEAVVERLKWSGVKLRRLSEDVQLPVEVYYIESYETVSYPYEGHYLHYNVAVRKEVQEIQYYKGDWIVDPGQEAMQYIVHVLEPQSVDGFFAWNFFDGILMQKEYFSGYVWDDTAAEILEKRPELKEQLEQKRAADPDFAKNHRAQLDFIYKNSEWFEKSHNRFPVARLMEEVVDLKTE